MKLQVSFLPSQKFKYETKVLLWPSLSLAPWSASNQRSNFEGKRLSEPQLGRKVHKMCTGGLGLELRD